MEQIIFQWRIYKLYEWQNYYIVTWSDRKHLHVAVWESVNWKVPEWFEIHHKDKNILNNDISNLEIKESFLHHSEHMKERWWENREKYLEQLKKASKLSKERHWSEEWLKWHKEHYEEMKEKLHEKKFNHICIVCGKEYCSNRPKWKFCWRNCQAKHRRHSWIDNVRAICRICGKWYIMNRYSKIQTCSWKCWVTRGWQNTKQRTRANH